MERRLGGVVCRTVAASSSRTSYHYRGWKGQDPCRQGLKDGNSDPSLIGDLRSPAPSLLSDQSQRRGLAVANEASKTGSADSLGRLCSNPLSSKPPPPTEPVPQHSPFSASRTSPHLGSIQKARRFCLCSSIHAQVRPRRPEPAPVFLASIFLCVLHVVVGQYHPTRESATATGRTSSMD